jgi:hypothetical protein
MNMLFLLNNVVDIFTKPLIEAIFINIHTLLGLQEAAIMGRCSSGVISPPKIPELCVDRGGDGTSRIYGSSHISSCSIGREVNPHLDTIGQAIDQHTILVGWVVDVPIGQIIDQQSKIVSWWIDQPNNRLRIGRIVGRVKSY